ncbi:MAG TPA: glycosyltransferase family 39 protein [Pirellulales bacterium]|nr:glycosyltransferase family 39 protein [Pirellulales bacterium]
MHGCMTTSRRPLPRTATVWLVATCLLSVVAFGAYHFYLRGLMLDGGLRLGAVRPGLKVYRIVPLYIYWRPRVKTGLLIAAGVVAAFVCWLRRSPACRGTDRYDRYCIPALVAWHIAIAVAVALVDGGPQKLWEPFTVHRRSDYIGAVAEIDNPREFLRDYAAKMSHLPLHCRHHPPGGPLLLWAVSRLFAPGPFAASLATIFLSGLAVPAVYLLARDVLGEAPARLAAGLFMLAPNVVAYSATCLDAVFMVPFVWTFYFLWHGREHRPLLAGAAGGLTASVAAMTTFSASFLALWGVVLLGLTAAFDRSRLRNAVLAVVSALVAAALFHAILYAWSNYDPLAVLRQAFAGQDEVMKGRGHSSMRQSLHFALTNLVAFAFCSGLPVAVLWLRQTGRELASASASPARWLLLSFGLTLLLVDLAPLYTLETERIWIFLVGFLAIGAARYLSQIASPSGFAPVVLTALLLQAGQTMLMEVLLDWVW